MQERQLSRRKRTFRAISFSVALFCLMLLFSSCANLSASSASPGGSAPTSAVPTPTARPLALKGDSNGIPSEAVLRGQLAKVFQAMAKMSLEQKLGQMIIVEYIGTDYQDTGLHYMVAQQYVGGYMYQESNHNFDSPYTLAS